MRLYECEIASVLDWKSVSLKECVIGSVRDWESVRLEESRERLEEYKMEDCERYCENMLVFIGSIIFRIFPFVIWIDRITK